MSGSVNLWAVLLAAVVQFVVGAVWYMPLFGNVWGKIHGFDRLSKKEQAAAQNGMALWLAVQFIVGLAMAYILAHFINSLPSVPWWQLVVWLWIGFVVTTQVGAVIFGGTKPEWIWQKIAIMAGGSLLCMMAGGWILSTL